jgi:ribonuclease HII
VIPEEIRANLDAADFVVGSDECGMGCWAGPFVVCAVVIPKAWPLRHLVKDSKAFSGKTAEAARERVVGQILKNLIFHVGSFTAREVDEIGIYKLMPIAHGKVIDAVLAKHEATGAKGSLAVIVDGNRKVNYGTDKVTMCLPKGDALVPAISAASIIGKVARDRAMIKLAAQYPGYGFENHKGYGGNREHDEGLKRLGPCDLHRKSFGPIRDLISKAETGSMGFSTLGGEED